MRSLDMCYRGALRCAFLALRVWWFIRRPDQHGALALIWFDDRVLLLRNSYQPLWSAPGGGVGPNEAAIDALVREIREEIGLVVSSADLRPLGDIEITFRFRHDRVSLFELRLSVAPDLCIDRREVVEARWFRLKDAAQLSSLPHLAEHFSTLLSEGAGHPSKSPCGRIDQVRIRAS